LIKSKNISRIDIITYSDESEQEIFTKSEDNNEKNFEHNNEKDFADNHEKNSENNDEKVESKNNNEKIHIMTSALFSKSSNVTTKFIVNDIESQTKFQANNSEIFLNSINEKQRMNLSRISSSEEI
jgi:hypothetical protein